VAPRTARSPVRPAGRRRDHHGGRQRSAGFGGDGGPATQAKLDGPAGLALDAAGNLYIADQGNDRVRRVDTNVVITTVAGDGR
jgi:DNA-binding beta-propeller fold protein YncE